MINNAMQIYTAKRYFFACESVVVIAYVDVDITVVVVNQTFQLSVW